jgi:GT2 family glycosyltransferase
VSLLTLVVPTRNRVAELRLQVEQLRALTAADPRLEVVYVDGGSSDGTRELLLSTPFELVLESRPHGLVRALNKGLKVASGEYLLFFNDDATFATTDFDAAIAAFVADPDLGLLALPTTFHGDRGVWQRWEAQGKQFKVMHYDGIPFANFGIAPRRLFAELGYFDERFSFMAFDPDFALRVWESGRKVLPCPALLVDHEGRDDRRRGAADNALRDEIWRERKVAIKRLMFERFGLAAASPGNAANDTDLAG